MERTDDESNKQPVILPPMIRIAYCTPSLHIPGGVESVADARLLANPASWSRVADSSPN